MPFGRGRRAGHRVQPEGRTEHSTICMAGPDRSRGFSRQVTTATPARLDFRASWPADEGCADTMSAEEPLQCSAVSGSLQGPAALGGAPPAASAAVSGPLRVAVAEESGWGSRRTWLALSTSRGDLRIVGAWANQEQGQISGDGRPVPFRRMRGDQRRWQQVHDSRRHACRQPQLACGARAGRWTSDRADARRVRAIAG